MSRSSEEQDARIALLQEYGSNARNWYTVLLGLAIAFFAVVQVRHELQLPSCIPVWQYTLCDFWPYSVAVTISQTLYVVYRDVHSSKLANNVIEATIPKVSEANGERNYLLLLRNQVDKETMWSRRLGKTGSLLIGWLIFTIVIMFLVTLTVSTFWPTSQAVHSLCNLN